VIQLYAAEWSALCEQLEVVPQLMQQLQTMTRQHEQLLSARSTESGGQISSSSSSSSLLAADEQEQQQNE
jgi:hypothetical protein